MDPRDLGVSEANENVSNDCDSHREKMREALIKVMSKIFSATVVIERLPDIDGIIEKRTDNETNSDLEDNKENVWKDCVKIEETHMCLNCMTFECSGCDGADESCTETTDTVDQCFSADLTKNVTNASNEKKSNRQSFLKYYLKYCSQCNKTQSTATRISKCEKCGLPWNYECKKCRKQLSTYNGITNHLRTKCMDKGHFFACFKCDYTSTNKYQVNVHLQKAHSIVDSLDRIEKFKSENIRNDVPTAASSTVSCAICERPFGALTDLLRHRQVCGQPKAQYKKLSHRTRDKCVHHCEKCNRTEKSPKTGKFYGKKCKICKSEFSYKCKECNRIFNSYNSVHLHLKVQHKVHSKDEFQCTDCDYKTSLFLYLCKHVRRKHGNGTHVCPKCKRQYNTPTACRDHVRYCTSDLEFECDYCLNKFKSKSNVQRHIFQKHTDGTEIDCHQCGLRLKNKLTLNVHMTYCQKEPQHRCHRCPFKTRHKIELSRHQIRIHSDVKKNENEK